MEEELAQSVQAENLAYLQTHLQVSNIVNILFTLRPEVLQEILLKTPENIKVAPHYKILEATYEYLAKVSEINESVLQVNQQ